MTIIVEFEVPEVTGNSKYPYIGRSAEGDTVLFTSEGTGVILGSSYYEVGHFSDGWGEYEFTPLPKGTTITLIQE
jgi:hypothetical protein